MKPPSYRRLYRHLFQGKEEQVAFGFARVRCRPGGIRFGIDEIDLVEAAGFGFQSGFHVRLTDGELARVIKKAWDLGTAIVEIHSHRGSVLRTAFSSSDLRGLEELVPHIWWRLRGRPYAALVLSPRQLDALVWRTSPHVPEPLDALEIGRQRISPTNQTLERIEVCYGP